MRSSFYTALSMKNCNPDELKHGCILVDTGTEILFIFNSLWFLNLKSLVYRTTWKILPYYLSRQLLFSILTAHALYHYLNWYWPFLQLCKTIDAAPAPGSTWKTCFVSLNWNPFYCRFAKMKKIQAWQVKQIRICRHSDTLVSKHECSST